MLFLRLEQEYFHKKRVEVLCTARCSCSFFDCTSIHGCFEWPPPVLGGALMPRPLFWSRRWAGLSIQKSPMASINLRQISKEAVSQNEAFCTSFSSCFYSFFFYLFWMSVSGWFLCSSSIMELVMDSCLPSFHFIAFIWSLAIQLVNVFRCYWTVFSETMTALLFALDNDSAVRPLTDPVSSQRKPMA